MTTTQVVTEMWGKARKPEALPVVQGPTEIVLFYRDLEARAIFYEAVSARNLPYIIVGEVCAADSLPRNAAALYAPLSYLLKILLEKD